MAKTLSRWPCAVCAVICVTWSWLTLVVRRSEAQLECKTGEYFRSGRWRPWLRALRVDDACVATPFVDFVTFVHNFGPASNDAVVRQALRNRYMDAWSDVVPHAKAIEWYERAEPLAEMHHAVSYRGIFDAFGSAEWWQFSWALPWWIEKALNSPFLRTPEA